MEADWLLMSETSKTNSIITIGNVLRHGVAGGVFVLSYCYSSNPHNPIEQLRLLNRAHFVVLALALLFGILIYSFHRACLNPLIELLRQALWKRSDKWWKWFKGYVVPEEIIRSMWRRWLYLSGSKDIHSHVTDWGDYIHLQYGTAWAVSLGSFAAWMTSAENVGWKPDCLLIAIVICCLVFGFFSDLRKHVMEQWLYRMNDAIQARLENQQEPRKSCLIELEIADATPVFQTASQQKSAGR